MPDAITDLEVRLTEPDGAAVRDRLVAQASLLEQHLRSRITRGLPRNEFPMWQAAADAAAAALEVLARWPVASDSAHATSATSSLYPSR